MSVEGGKSPGEPKSCSQFLTTETVVSISTRILGLNQETTENDYEETSRRLEAEKED